jgi:hypothetical protein
MQICFVEVAELTYKTHINCQDFYTLSKLEHTQPILGKESEILKEGNVETLDSILKHIF